MLELVCPSCDRHFGVAENAAGEAITCPYCSTRTRAPELVAVLASAVAAKPAPPGRGSGHSGAFWTPMRAAGLLLMLASAGLVAWALVADYQRNSYRSFSTVGKWSIGLAIVGGLLGFAMFLAGRNDLRK